MLLVGEPHASEAKDLSSYCTRALTWVFLSSVIVAINLLQKADVVIAEGNRLGAAHGKTTH
ncbi:hypothetical protein [Nitrospira sp. Nam74]